MGWLFVWWFLFTLVGLLTFPLALPTFRYLPDKGYAFSRILGLLFVGYVCWMLGHLSYHEGVLWGVFLVLIGTSAWFLSRTSAAVFHFFKGNFAYVAVVECLFLAAFLSASAYKMRTPEILGTEKPMDLAMVNAIFASPSLPPSDPWFAGAGISYYYFGYFLTATLAKLTGTPTGVAYNLGVVTAWSLAALGAFGVGFALTRRYRFALLSSLSVSLLGNLDFWHRAVQSFRVGDLRIPYYHQSVEAAEKGWGALWAFLSSPLSRSWDYFQASRIVPVPPSDKLINEFPAFSFFLSDLHPHVMAVPFVLLAAGLALNLLKAPLPGWEAFGRRRGWRIFQGVLTAAVFGSLGILNSWDYPTLLVLLALALAFQSAWSGAEGSKEWFRRLAVVGLPLAVGSFLLYLPFYLGFQSQAEGVGLASQRTGLYHFFVLFGLFLVPAVPALISRAAQASVRARGRKAPEPVTLCVVCGTAGAGKRFCGLCGGEIAPSPDGEVQPVPLEPARDWFGALSSAAGRLLTGRAAAACAAGAALLLFLLDLGTLNLATALLSTLLLGLCLAALGARSESKEGVFTLLLAALAFSLVLFCEFFYVKDLFGRGDTPGPLHRMNTVFKFHYQAWLLLSLAAPALLKGLLEARWGDWGRVRRRTLVAALAFVGIGSLAYPLLTWKSRAAASPWRTLDGTVAFRRAFPADAEAVAWIRANVRPKGRKMPVLLEAWGGSYSSHARIATYTGYPTVLGWDFHEAQWRGSWDRPAVRGGDPEDTVLRRRGDVDAAYQTQDLEEARRILKRYGVDYVYVGGLERQKYAASGGLEKFAALGQPVFSQAGAVLYRLNP